MSVNTKSVLVPCLIVNVCSSVVMEHFYLVLLLVFILCIHNFVNCQEWDACCCNIFKLVIILFFQGSVKNEGGNFNTEV